MIEDDRIALFCIKITGMNCYVICTLEFTKIHTYDAITCKYVRLSGKISFHGFSDRGLFFHYVMQQRNTNISETRIRGILGTPKDTRGRGIVIKTRPRRYEGQTKGLRRVK